MLHWTSFIHLGDISLTFAAAAAITTYLVSIRATHFRDSTGDYEALSVARNAPRWIKSLKRFGFLSDPI